MKDICAEFAMPSGRNIGGRPSDVRIIKPSAIPWNQHMIGMELNPETVVASHFR
jgi:hypothetical protein